MTKINLKIHIIQIIENLLRVEIVSSYKPDPNLRLYSSGWQYQCTFFLNVFYSAIIKLLQNILGLTGFFNFFGLMFNTSSYVLFITLIFILK